MSRSFVHFSVGGEPLALALEDVRAIHEPQPLSPLPGLGPAVRGLASVHGHVQMVLDLAAGSGRPVDAAQELYLLLDGTALGIALRIEGSVGFTAASATAGGVGTLASFCSASLELPGGERAGILDPESVLRSMTAA